MFKVSKSGYYNWLNRGPSKRRSENEALTMAIRGIQGQLWELRGTKDQGGALEKGISRLKAQGGQDNEIQQTVRQKKEKVQGHHGQQTRLSDSAQYTGP